MAIILSIETSTSVCSAALHKDDQLLAVQELHTRQSAGAQLTTLIEQIITYAKVSKSEIDAVAVASGPGSYTGLRIGVATAKGLCFGLGVPLIAIDSLLILASSVNDTISTDLLCPMIDARRMEVYCSLLTPSLAIVEPTHARIIDSESFNAQLAKHSISFFGDGAEKCRSTLKGENAVFPEGIFISAQNMGKLAFQKFQTKQFEDLTAFEPNYLKEFVAKTKLK